MVYRDYEADTLEAAAAMMLRDPDIWDSKMTLRRVEPEHPALEFGSPNGYTVDSWTYDGSVLRVWFR